MRTTTMIVALLLSGAAYAQPISSTHGVTANSADKAPVPGVSDATVKSGQPFRTTDGDECREVMVTGVRQWLCTSMQAANAKPVYTFPRSGWDR